MAANLALTGSVSNYGVLPPAQRASSIQATSAIASYTGTSSMTVIGALLVEIANTFIGLGAWKGSA